MKFKYKCEICGKQLRSKKAVAGHMWMAHDIRVGNKAEVKRLREENKDLNTTIKKEVDNDGKAIEEIKEELVALKNILTDLFKTLEKKEIKVNPDEKPKEQETFLEKINRWLGSDDEEEETEENPDEKKGIFL